MLTRLQSLLRCHHPPSADPPAANLGVKAAAESAGVGPLKRSGRERQAKAPCWYTRALEYTTIVVIDVLPRKYYTRKWRSNAKARRPRHSNPLHFPRPNSNDIRTYISTLESLMHVLPFIPVSFKAARILSLSMDGRACPLQPLSDTLFLSARNTYYRYSRRLSNGAHGTSGTARSKAI